MNLADSQNWYLFEQEMNASNSTLHKREVLEKWKDNEIIQWTLRQTYDPFTQYYVSKKALQKLKVSDISKVKNKQLVLPELLTLLATRKITGHEALHTTKYFVDNCGYGDIVLKLLNRDAELRAGTTLINEAIPGLIPKFECQLAEKYDPKRVNLLDIWFASRKLDGVRCLIIINDIGAINFFSRSGKEFNTLDKIRKELEPLGLRNVVFDGEVCIIDEHGNESFQGIMSEVTNKDHTMENPKFICFDMVTLKEFTDRVGTPDRPYKVRYQEMNNFFTFTNLQHMELLEHVEIENDEQLVDFAKKMEDEDREGYMLNKNTPYKGKRSFDLLKGKIMEDGEFQAIEAINGPISVIINGISQKEEMLSAIVIKYKEATVRVGSGFSLEERRLYYKHPELIVDKIVRVQFFEETVDKKGKLSLRFPVFVYNFGNERTV